MKTLDLFKDWTPEMLSYLQKPRRGRGSYERTEKHREKMSEIFTGRTYGPQTMEHRRKISITNLGQTRSEEQRRRIAGSQIGKVVSKETRKKISEARIGHLVSGTTRRVISEALIGRTISWATKINMSESHIGSFPSERTKRKQSEAHMGHLVSTETREKISVAHITYWAGLSDKEYLERTKSLGTKSFPTEPEKFMGWYLENRFPGMWEYSGTRGPLPRVRKKPDFIRKDGTKEVVEVFGVFYHKLEEEDILVEHYAKYGYKCRVIWQYDCYLWNELDRIFREELEKWNIR